jgi:predicted RNase H-like HicB family nuclease
MNDNKAQDKPSGDDTRERITGPFKGYHVVAIGCAVEGSGPGFRGYYKICRDHPTDYWTAHSLAQGRCGPQTASGAGAMQMAESAAAIHIDGMPDNASPIPTAQRRIP